MISAGEGAGRKTFDLTESEVRRFQDAFKTPEFKELFCDYMKEISDPKNRELYEKELLALEAERGARDPEILRTAPGLCVKTFFAETKNPQKVFINLCRSAQIGELRKQAGEDPNGSGKKGTQWQIPYALAGSGREDKDKAGKPAIIFDCAFHPDAITRALVDVRFREVLVQMAMEAVQKHSGCALSKEYVMPKNLHYKGSPRALTVLKNHPEVPPTASQEATPCAEVPPTASQEATTCVCEKTQFLADLEQLSRNPVPISSEEPPTSAKNAPLIQELDTVEPAQNTPSKPQQPAYKLISRGIFDMGRYTDARVKTEIPGRPDALVIRVDLPLVKSAAEVNLDVTESRFSLDVPRRYFLELNLPYPVDYDNGTAKFDVGSCILEVTLPVQPAPVPLNLTPIADATPAMEETSKEHLVPEMNGDHAEEAVVGGMPEQANLPDEHGSGEACPDDSPEKASRDDAIRRSAGIASRGSAEGRTAPCAPDRCGAANVKMLEEKEFPPEPVADGPGCDEALQPKPRDRQVPAIDGGDLRSVLDTAMPPAAARCAGDLPNNGSASGPEGYPSTAGEVDSSVRLHPEAETAEEHPLDPKLEPIGVAGCSPESVEVVPKEAAAPAEADERSGNRAHCVVNEVASGLPLSLESSKGKEPLQWKNRYIFELQ